ncbi:uncharacterized protein LOC141627555 [Silene latifolia]|uniref:uncharacterized protein LOC141627555 n=1 Tax=Silene latifolia TaxID=37657 RepID=UPI003D77BF29
MAGNDTTPPTKLHPVYSVSNIQHKVRVLDGVKVPYSSWVKLFKLHARGYKVLYHIDGTDAPAKTAANYAEWCEIDAHVLQWIYGTLSDDLLSRVLEDESTAHEAWERVKGIFTNNKGSRAAALENEFSNLKLGAMPTLESYCQRLKELAGQLKDVDVTVSDQCLVLQLVRDLPKDYDTTAAYINQTLPTFAAACSMLELEQQRQAVRVEPATALVAPSSHGPEISDEPQQPPRSNNRGRHQKSNNRSGGRSNNRGSQKSQSNSSQSNWTRVQWTPPPWSAPWPMPPCPYPTQPGWSTPWQPWTNQPNTRAASSSRSSWKPPTTGGYGTTAQAHMADTEAPLPTDLVQAFNAISFNPNDGQWYMDTGASSHITAYTGTLSPSSKVSNIRSIYVGNGSSIPVQGTGTTTIPTTDRPLKLTNVLYTPHIIKNLISVRQFTKDNNVSVEFDPLGFSVKDLRTGTMILRSNSHGELYPVSTTESPSSSKPFVGLTSSTWHQRVGHPTPAILSRLSFASNFRCNKEPGSNLCSSCQISKHRRLPFVESHSISTAPFNIIHADL